MLFTDLLQTPVRPAEGAEAVQRFLHLLGAALGSRSLHKLVLSAPTAEANGVARILGRQVDLRGAPSLQLVHRHPTKDITKNHPAAEAIGVVEALLRSDFRSAHLLTPQHELHLSIKLKGGKDKSFLRVGKPASAKALPALDDDTALEGGARSEADAASAPAAHNREKHRLLDLNAPYWVDLGISHAQHGRTAVVPAMARKWKQINKFTELFDSALAEAAIPAGAPLRVIDFGCGKGYLTFAMHAHLKAQHRQAQVMGVELRPELVSECNSVVDRHGCDGLRFDAGDVRTYAPGALDVMVALHACDTATDHAIHLGLQAGAAVIMCSPCCHKEIRPQLQAPALLRPLLQHGVHLGQEAEMVTDSLRALLLEARGYRTKIFEFVTLEHTNKNKMILAVRQPEPTDEDMALAREQLQRLKDFYGLRQQTLETLLG